MSGVEITVPTQPEIEISVTNETVTLTLVYISANPDFVHNDLNGRSADDAHPISSISGLQTALDTKAPLASPALTGTPTAPTAAANTSTTQIATTAFAKTEADDAQAFAIQRANHTGTQLAATISDLATAVLAITVSVYDPLGAAATAQAFAIQRANHTGTQLAATISDFNTAALAATAAAYDPAGSAAAAQSAAIAYSIQRANHTGTQLAATISDFNAAALAATSAAYDPAGAAAAAQAFSIQRANHTGTQLAATISDFSAAALAATAAAYDPAGSAAAAQAFSIQRANHTGTQLAATISDFASAVVAAGGGVWQPLDSTLTALAGTAFGAANTVLTSNGTDFVWSPSLTMAGAVSAVGLSSSSGLTVSSGTSALQAVTCTTLTTSAVVAATHDNAAGAYTRWRYGGSDRMFAGVASQVISGGLTTDAAISSSGVGSKVVIGVNTTGVLSLSSTAAVFFTDPGGSAAVRVGGDLRCAALTTTGTYTNTASGQSTVWNGATGTYCTWQFNGTSVGDIGTADEVIGGGSSGDFGISSRAGSIRFGLNGTLGMTLASGGALTTVGGITCTTLAASSTVTASVNTDSFPVFFSASNASTGANAGAGFSFSTGNSSGYVGCFTEAFSTAALADRVILGANNAALAGAGVYINNAAHTFDIIGSGATVRARFPSGGGLILGTGPTGNAMSVNTSAAPLHFTSSGSDDGGYIEARGTSAFYNTAGGRYSSFSGDYIFTAKADRMSGLIMESAGLIFWRKAATLTVGNTYTIDRSATVTNAGTWVFGTATAAIGAELARFAAGGAMPSLGLTDVCITGGKIGVGDTSATSIQTAGAVTLAAIAATTTAGAVQRESNQDKLYSYSNSIGGWHDKCIFSQYASVTQAGIVTGQSLASGTARGTRTLPANWWKQGKVLRFRLCGRYTTDASAGNATIDIKIGSTTFRSSGSFALDNSSTNQPWILEGEITCYTTGATGTIEGVTWWGHGVSAATNNADIEPMAGSGTVTIDTTASAAFDVQWTATDSGTSITCTCFRLFEVC